MYFFASFLLQTHTHFIIHQIIVNQWRTNGSPLHSTPAVRGCLRTQLWCPWEWGNVFEEFDKVNLANSVSVAVGFVYFVWNIFLWKLCLWERQKATRSSLVPGPDLNSKIFRIWLRDGTLCKVTYGRALQIWLKMFRLAYKYSKPTNQPTNQPINQPNNHPPTQPTNQTTKQPTNQSTTHPPDQPTNQLINQLTNQTTNKPINHPPTQPTNQPPKLPNKQTNWPTD